MASKTSLGGFLEYGDQLANGTSASHSRLSTLSELAAQQQALAYFGKRTF
jgi:hypothetical protein